ncbi:MAG: response regulator [Desulfobacteraceae bacterium]|nr:response regulator [Desulfobacteraceae bacterium]
MDNTNNEPIKKILIVDDEVDILETLEELLDMFNVETASSFEEAVTCLKTNTYDIAILDIMGVRGYDLLEATKELGIPTLMITAHALSPANLEKSIELGADAYIPKDKLVDITLYIEDVLTARKNKSKPGTSWFSRLTPFFNNLFGQEWQESEKKFWDEFDKK